MKLFDNLKKQRSLLALVIAIIVLALLPITNIPPQWILYLFLLFFYLAAANIWNLLAGYCGLISLCQPAFLGVGGYTVVFFTSYGLPWYWAIIVGGIVAALFAAIVTIPTFRLKGIFFAIGTLIIPEILRVVMTIWKPLPLSGGGGAGYLIPGIKGVSSDLLYWMALIVGMGTFLMVRYILYSKVGLGLAAIRDNDMAASTSGVHVSRLKFNVFIAGAFITGIAGAIFYVYRGFIRPDAGFNLSWTVQMMVATVIGGIGILEGPLVGTAIVVILQFALARASGVSMLIQGLILIAILLVAPKGIVGTLKSINWRRIPPKYLDESTVPK